MTKSHLFDTLPHAGVWILDMPLLSTAVVCSADLTKMGQIIPAYIHMFYEVSIKIHMFHPFMVNWVVDSVDDRFVFIVHIYVTLFGNPIVFKYNFHPQSSDPIFHRPEFCFSS